jgi:hypothetical protein
MSIGKWLTSPQRRGPDASSPFRYATSHERFELDTKFSAVFERFEVVWPLDGTDMIAGLKGDGKDR